MSTRNRISKILTVIILFTGMNTFAQNKAAYDVSKDAKNGEQVFNGPLTFEDLGKEKSFTWLNKGRNEYNPDPKTMMTLRTSLKDYSMVVFLGTWCDDSHDLIPKLQKVMELAGYPVRQLTMYGADREKKTKNGEHKKYNITLVPTIILYKDDKEAGRITESVQKSVEADLLAIIDKEHK